MDFTPNMKNPVLEWEQQAAACGLIDAVVAIGEAGHLLTPADFSDPLCGSIWGLAQAAADLGEKLNLLKVMEAHSGQQDEVIIINGKRMTAIGAIVPATRVKAESRRRQAMAKAERDIAELRNADHEEVDAVIARQCDESAALAAEDQRAIVVSGGHALKAWTAELKVRFDNRTAVPFLGSGIKELDHLTRGWRPGHVYCLGADTGHGKTIFGCWAAAWAAEKEDARALYVSAEVPHIDIIERMVAARAHVNGEKMVTGMLTDQELHGVLAAVKGMVPWASKNIGIFDPPRITVPMISSALRRAEIQQKPYRLVVVDYIQLIGTDEQTYSRERELAKIAEQLRSLAHRYNVSVLFLSQLNAERKKRTPPLPALNDLRECKAMAHPCTAGMLLFRPEKEGLQTFEIFRNGARVEVNTKGLALIMVPKNRNGRDGTAYATMTPQFQQFSDWYEQRFGEDAA
jgi:replicative DNA helicase